MGEVGGGRDGRRGGKRDRWGRNGWDGGRIEGDRGEVGGRREGKRGEGWRIDGWGD